jgi:hypothetical protein
MNEKWVEANEVTNFTSSKLKSLGNANWLEMLDMGIPIHAVHSAVLDYSLKNRATRAFVFFSMDDELVSSLLRHLFNVSEIQIVYAESFDLTEIGKLNLIELCYGDKAFFTDRIQRRMSRERFVYSSKAFIVLYCWDKTSEELRGLKESLRSKLSGVTFERRIHGTDGLLDTQFLVEALTNHNSRLLLNRIKLSRNDRIFSRVPDLFRHNQDVCIDGSSVMELYGLRKSRDLDVICTNRVMANEVLSSGFDLNNDHYRWLPLTAEQVIADPYLHVKLYGIKYTALTVRQLELESLRESPDAAPKSKKLRDLELIASFNSGRQNINQKWMSLIGTSFTQIRLLFELFVLKVSPHIPQKILRAIRSVKSRYLAR